MGNFPALLASLEDLSVAVTKGLQKNEKAYSSSTVQDQFVSRFLARETAFQLSKLSAMLEDFQKRLQEDGIPLIDGSDSEEEKPLHKTIPNCSNFPAAVGPQSLQVYKPCPSRLLPVRLRKQVVTQTSIHLEGMPRHPNCLKKTRCTPSAHFVSLLLESSQDLGAQIKRLEAIVEKLANQVGIHFHLV